MQFGNFQNARKFIDYFSLTSISTNNYSIVLLIFLKNKEALPSTLSIKLRKLT